MIEIINANCLDILKETAANSQDLIFCDYTIAETRLAHHKKQKQSKLF